MQRKNVSLFSYRQQLADVCGRLSLRTVDLDIKHIVIVPDRMTLTAENAICELLGGAFDVSVFTFNRLFTRLAGGGSTYLPAQGSVMLIKKLLANSAAELTCFTKSSKKKGFAAAVYDIISMLIGCNVPPGALRGIRGKGRDLAVIYEKYLAATEGKLTDAGGRLKLLGQYLENSDYLSNAHIYIVGFDNLTPRMRDIIDITERKALSLTQYSLAPKKPVLGDVELYSAPSRVAVAKAAVCRIARAIKDGAKPDDFCIVTEGGGADEAKRILDENGIPYFADEKLKLSAHPLGRLLSSAVGSRTGAYPYRAADVIRLTKNVLTGINRGDADCFERYVVSRRKSYKDLFEPFAEGKNETESDSALRRGAERARAAAARLLRAEGRTFHEFAESLISEAEKNYGGLIKERDGGAGRANPFEKARGLLRLTAGLLSGAGFELTAEAFLEGMDATELTMLPQVRGAVEIGDESAFRARRHKYVFILDFELDNHPRRIADTALISDDDILLLRGGGADVSPTTREVNKRREEELLQLLTGADSVFLGHTQKPGFFWETLKGGADFKKNPIYSSSDCESYELDSCGGAETLIKYCPTPSFLLEQHRIALSLTTDGFDPPPAAPLLEAATDGEERRKFDMPEDETEAADIGGLALAFEAGVSQIEAYCACPRMHYFRYALGAKPPQAGETMPVDIGNILHLVADGYVKSGCGDPESLAGALLDAALLKLEEETGRVCEERYKEMLKKESRLLLGEIDRHLRAGSYTAAGSEVKFSGVELTAGAAKPRLSLRGKIDRVDISGGLVRIIDYKTGGAEFSLDNLYGGVKLQLLIYLGVALGGFLDITKGKELAPGGAYYFQVRADWESEATVMNGLTVDTAESITAADGGALAAGASTVISLKTSRGKIKVVNGVSEPELRLLADYAFKMAEQAAAEIDGGYIAASPCDTRICAYCDYSPCCDYEGDGRTLPKARL